MARNNKRRDQNFKKEPKEFEEKVIQIKRLSKKTKGGNKISFSALVVIGNKKGKVGIGLDKASDVVSAIKKAIKVANKKLAEINLVDGTIPHEITYSKGSSLIVLKPAPEGTGVIAGGSVRAVVEAAGIKNIVAKSIGTKNKNLNVNATFNALKSLKAPAKKSKKQIVNKIKETKKPAKKAGEIPSRKGQAKSRGVSKPKKTTAKKVVKKTK